MQTRNLARLLSLAVASHRSGNPEDSHEMFDMFLQEVAAAERLEAEDLCAQIEQIVTSALTESEIPETIVEDLPDTGLTAAAEVVEETTVAAVEDDDDDPQADLAVSFFDRHDEDFNEEDLASNAIEDDVVLNNLRALRKTAA